MRTRYTMYGLLVAAMMLLCIGCESSAEAPPSGLVTKQLHQFYPGDLSKVDHIEIRDGSTGELKTYTDARQVQRWLSEVRGMSFEPDPNQDVRVGFLYFVDLFEGNDRKLRFTPSEVDGHYYLYNKDLEERIRELFESK